MVVAVVVVVVEPGRIISNILEALVSDFSCCLKLNCTSVESASVAFVTTLAVFVTTVPVVGDMFLSLLFSLANITTEAVVAVALEPPPASRVAVVVID